ncbi:methyltransferase domain-containing protein, partial [Enterobacter cloacae complex sp.6701062]|uniref:methyltransferase domain-containing protein n=1 Tax=Enterobacter cloacae complex sp.6701062 TaxID=3397177 RepID=UPI003AAD0134
DNLFKDINIADNDKVLDLGTGHGLVLIEMAKKLSVDGLAVGIDLWQDKDQWSNEAIQTENNVCAAQLQCETQIDTGDIQRLPYNDEQYNV